MGTELDATAHWAGLFAAQLNVSVRRGRLTALTDSLSTTLRVAAPLVLLAFGALGVIHGTMSLGSTLALLALAQGVLTPLSSVVNVAGQFQLLGSYIERLDDVLTAPREQTLGTLPPAPQVRGGIQLNSVSFRYQSSAPEVVRNVSVTIEPGQFVAIVGCSGSGKSTLANLLLGLYRPLRGQILFDGINITEVEARSLRRQLGIVNQRPYLFAGTIRANIAASDPTLSLEHIVAAARSASIHDEIARLPMGYQTLLSDGGGSLSGGQRQRLALARALARRPAILVLDEATSSLDSLAERAVQRELEGLGCTRIVIAHRLSTIREADLILVMRNGELVEQGAHDQLVARCGHYAELVAGQALVDSAASPPSQRQRPELVPVEPNRR
jgi:ABC-type bacteriocin/lantibiotic exporter with double-glycine peptidase domain